MENNTDVDIGISTKNSTTSGITDNHSNNKKTQGDFTKFISFIFLLICAIFIITYVLINTKSYIRQPCILIKTEWATKDTPPEITVSGNKIILMGATFNDLVKAADKLAMMMLGIDSTINYTKARDKTGKIVYVFDYRFKTADGKETISTIALRTNPEVAYSVKVNNLKALKRIINGKPDKYAFILNKNKAQFDVIAAVEVSRIIGFLQPINTQSDIATFFTEEEGDRFCQNK